MGKSIKRQRKYKCKYNYFMEIADAIIISVADLIDKYRFLPNVKFYFILGKYSKHFGFENNLFQKEKYEEIKLFLESCTTWEFINEKNFEMNGMKEKILDNLLILCKNCSYDIMVNVIESSCKFDCDYNYELGNVNANIFKKKNHTFILCALNNNLKQIYYTFKISAYIQKDYSSIYISHSSLLKMCDVLSKLNNTKEIQFEII
jgi:hypothetical protein